MSIDIKRLLYSYQKLQVSLQNIRDSIKREQSKRQYPSMTPRYSDEIQGKGGLVSSQTERYALFNIELDEGVQYLLWDQEEHEYVIGLIESAYNTLNERQKQLIRLHYFQAREHVNAALEMDARMTQYYHWHKLAIDGIEQCLNSGRVFKNRLIPMKKKVRSCKKSGVLVENAML